jgi:hypothetical protein
VAEGLLCRHERAFGHDAPGVMAGIKTIVGKTQSAKTLEIPTPLLGGARGKSFSHRRKLRCFACAAAFEPAYGIHPNSPPLERPARAFSTVGV